MSLFVRTNTLIGKCLSITYNLGSHFALGLGSLAAFATLGSRVDFLELLFLFPLDSGNMLRRLVFVRKFFFLEGEGEREGLRLSDQTAKSRSRGLRESEQTSFSGFSPSFFMVSSLELGFDPELIFNPIFVGKRDAFGVYVEIARRFSDSHDCNVIGRSPSLTSSGTEIAIKSTTNVCRK